MEKQYYNEYYKLEREHWWFKARLKILDFNIKKRIFKGLSFSILNAGAATGATSIMLKNYGTVQSLEYDKECSIYLSEILNEEVSNASLTALPYSDKSYNLVCAFDVIEHIEDDTKAIKEIHRVLKEDGYIYISVPAFNLLWSKHDEINHHYRRYRLKNLITLIANNGFQIEYASYFNFFLFLPILIIRLFSRLLPDNLDKNSTGSDFEKFNSNKFLNKLMYHIFLSEIYFFRLGLRLPFGVSSMIIAKKSPNK